MGEMIEEDQRIFKDGMARHYMKHKVYCSSCSHYEIEVSHWDGTSFAMDLVCGSCGNKTNYVYENPYDRNGWRK